MKKKLLAVAAAIATLPAAYAVDFKAGNWDLSLGGNANAFYTYKNPPKKKMAGKKSFNFRRC